jgi:hypothetical protein
MVRIFIAIISMMAATCFLMAQSNGENIQWEYREGFAKWEDGRKLVWLEGDTLKVPDSIKVVVVDTAAAYYKVILRVVYDVENRNVVERESWYVRDGIYYMRAYLFFTTHNKYISSDISLQQYRQLKLDQPKHNAWSVSLHPTFTWHQLWDSRVYQIQVASDSLFTDVLAEEFVSNDTTYTLLEYSMMPGLERYWLDTLMFDGTQDALVEDGWNYELEKFSLALWMMPDKDGQVYTSVMAGVDDGTTPGYQRYALSFNPENKIRFRIRPNLNTIVTNYSTTVVPLNEWVHIVGTYDGVAKRLYINGELEWVKNVGLAMNYADADVFVIGASYFLPENRRYSGKLKGIGVWDYDIGIEGVKRLYDAGVDAVYPLVWNVLEINKRYYWRVRPYDDVNDLYGQWSGK